MKSDAFFFLLMLMRNVSITVFINASVVKISKIVVALYFAVEGLVVFSLHHLRCVPHVAADALDPVQIFFVLDLKWRRTCDNG